MAHFVFHVVSTAFYWVVAYLFFIVFSFLWLPFYFYKLLLALFVKCFVSNLEGMLPAFEALISDEDISIPYNNSSIIAVLELKGNPTISKIQKIFEVNVLNATLKPSGLSRYSKLKQYPVSFLGHSFWKQDSNFSLSNHIWEHDNDKCAGFLNKLYEDILSFKHPENKSPWQLVLVRSAEQQTSNLVFRIHHSLCDARSVLKLVVECFGGKPLSASEAVYKPMSLISKAKYFLKFPVELANIATMMQKSEKRIVNHPLNGLNTRIDSDKPFHVAVTKKISIRGIKDVAIRNKVKTSAVLLSAITSTVNKFLRTLENPVTTENDLTLYMTLPKEGHPPTLANHASLGMTNVKINLQDRIGSLQICDQVYEEMRHGHHSRYMMALFEVMAILPKPLRKHLSGFRASTTGMTNISGERDGFFVGTSECTDFSMCASIPESSFGVFFILLSYKQHLKVSILGRGTTLSEQETNLIAKILEDELLELVEG